MAAFTFSSAGQLADYLLVAVALAADNGHRRAVHVSGFA